MISAAECARDGLHFRERQRIGPGRDLARPQRPLESCRRVVGERRDAGEFARDAERVARKFARLLGILRDGRGALEKCAAFREGLTQEARAGHLEARGPPSAASFVRRFFAVAARCDPAAGCLDP